MEMKRHIKTCVKLTTLSVLERNGINFYLLSSAQPRGSEGYTAGELLVSEG